MTADEREIEAAIVARALEGDRSAWGELIERYTPLVFSIPRRYGLTADDSADITQTVFAILLSRLSTVRDARSLPKWLVTTTTRECARFIRKRRQAPISTGDEVWAMLHADDYEHLDAEARRMAVREALARIGERCQALLLALFNTEGTPDYRAISHSLGIPVGSIGPTRARCLKKLSGELAADPASAAMFGLHQGEDKDEGHSGGAAGEARRHPGCLHA